MGAWNEQLARDRLMDYFVSTDPIDIALQRPVWVATAAGGKVQAGVIALDPQRFHVYPFKRRLTIETTFNPQTFGEEKVEYIHYILIFNRNHDIQGDDFFNPLTDVINSDLRLEEGRYEVSFVSARFWDRGQAGILFRG